MAFHVACPFTCRKVCYCTFGMPAQLRTQSGQNEFLQKTSALQNLLTSPRLMLGGGPEYVEIPVPPLPNQPKKSLEDQGVELLDDSGDDGLTKRAGTRRKATFSIVGQADASVKSSHSKKLESAKYASRQHASREALANGWADRERAGMLVRGGPEDALGGVEHFESLVPQIVCGLCGCGEAIGSDKAGRMLSCQACRKQYHRKCTKHWAEHRDLFNWASWTCGSCRICEICTRTGDSNKLMFCKRCDHAHHSTCLQPPLKHVPKGPFVCPKHVRCTSCSTTIPGGGMSSKWFLSYSLCDACGRLFTRGKYCPICLKVYRDSEPAPMVCCDVCEHWVHCECDGISDEKYEEFQVNSQLRYICASCRGECYKVADLDEAAIEIWRRKDIKDAVQIAEIRAAAGLPSQEEIANACPSSDEEDREPEGNEVEEASKKSSRRKVKKLAVGAEGLIKNSKTSKKVTIKDGSKSKTPSKVEGTHGKFNLILQPVNPEKTITSTKKSKKGSTTSGDGQEKLLQNKDPIINSVAESKDPEKMKKTVLLKKIVPPSGVEIAVNGPKDKKRKSEGSKEKSSSTKKQRSSKAVELDTVRNYIPQDGSGKIKKLKITNPQEIAVRQGQSKVPSTSFERHVIQGCNYGVKERTSVKVSKKESDFDLTCSASHGDTATIPESQIEVGDADNSVVAQQTQAGRGSSPLHWAGHSDSVRRRRVPSSKYRDMDTSAWRHSRTNKELLSTQNPESESTAQTFNEQIETVIPAQNAPTLPITADSRKEHQRKPDNVEDNVDNDDSLEAPRKKLKMTDLSERKADAQLLHNSLASDSPATTRLLRVKIRKQPSRETVMPGVSKDSKKSGEEVGEAAHVKGHQPSKKKRSAASQKSTVEDSAQRLLAIKDAAGDDSWILQRLGTDAISKRVEIFWPIDDIWYKGTVVAVFPDQLKFSVDYDDGEQETLEFGKEKVRLLSTTKKF